MENNNPKKHKNIGKVVLIIMSILFIAIGGSGLDSESILIPSAFILAGLACGVASVGLDDEI